MKKAKTKILSFTLCALMVLVATFGVVGCKRDTVNIDTTKTQLYIGAYGGGFGTAYLDDLKARFEEYAKEISYEEGKKGVQIFYQEDKDKYRAGTFKDTISYDSNELFYLSGDELDDFLHDGEILEITDVVTTPLTEFGETESIADKLRDEVKDHVCRDGKYYSMPFADTSTGIIYDIDVFEDYSLYIAKNGAPSEALQVGGSFDGVYKWVGASNEKSAGPDGVYETVDDGLPATLEEFEKLMSRMSIRGVSSVIWTGQYADSYVPFLIQAFHADYHGVEGTKIYYNGGGENGVETEIITSFNGDEPVIENRIIGLNKNNIKELGKQAGYYYGLKMYEIMLKSGTVSKYTLQELSHVRTQEAFLVSNWRIGETPIAMMVDGTWWETEAETSGTFKDCVTEFGESASRINRRFGVLPMPKATLEDIGEERTIVAGGNSIVIRSGISAEKAKLAKDFLRFSLTNESLSSFTGVSGLVMPFNYKVNAEDSAKMSHFAKNYLEIYSSSKIVYPFMPAELSSNSGLLEAQKMNTLVRSLNNSGVRYSLFPTEVIYNGLTAKEYFLGIYRTLG